MIEHICKKCGISFMDYKSNKRIYCSLVCSQKKIVSDETRKKLRESHIGVFSKENHPMWKGGRVSIECQNCNNSFMAYEKENRMFCSKECKYISGRDIRECAICRREYSLWKSIKKQFCSKDCYIVYQKQNGNKFGTFKKGQIAWNKGLISKVRGENHPSWKGGMISIKCGFCENFFQDHKSNNRLFCSKQCADYMKIGKIIKPKESKDMLNIYIRSCSFYKEWRTSIFERDNYTCQDCGIRSGNGNGKVILNADHIIPFALIVQINKISSVEEALNCDQLWDIKNGRTLCRNCHFNKKTHGYGTQRLLKISIAKNHSI